MTGIHSRGIYKSDNRPSWWPKDVVFSHVRGISSEAHTVDVFKINFVQYYSLIIMHVIFGGLKLVSLR